MGHSFLPAQENKTTLWICEISPDYGHLHVAFGEIFSASSTCLYVALLLFAVKELLILFSCLFQREYSMYSYQFSVSVARGGVQDILTLPSWTIPLTCAFCDLMGIAKLSSTKAVPIYIFTSKICFPHSLKYNLSISFLILAIVCLSQ